MNEQKPGKRIDIDQLKQRLLGAPAILYLPANLSKWEIIEALNQQQRDIEHLEGKLKQKEMIWTNEDSI